MRASLPLILLATFAGCVSVDENVRVAREAILAGTPATAVGWGENVATDSVYSKNLGKVEAGRLAIRRFIKSGVLVQGGG